MLLNTTLYCRYRFICFYLFSSLTSSVGKENLKVDYSSKNRVRIWPDLLDRNDGSYIARFRLFETYQEITISVKYKDEHIANSPYHLKGLFFASIFMLPSIFDLLLVPVC